MEHNLGSGNAFQRWNVITLRRFLVLIDETRLTHSPTRLWRIETKLLLVVLHVLQSLTHMPQPVHPLIYQLSGSTYICFPAGDQPDNGNHIVAGFKCCVSGIRRWPGMTLPPGISSSTQITQTDFMIIPDRDTGVLTTLRCGIPSFELPVSRSFMKSFNYGRILLRFIH